MVESLKQKRVHNPASDFEIQKLIGESVAKDILGSINDISSVSIGALSKNYYSYTFSLKVMAQTGEKNVFVKIPKADFLGISSNILPISSRDRLMAREEELSLRLLEKKWVSDEQNVQWVTLCGTIAEYNVLVTDRVFAKDATSVLRRLDLRRRIGLSLFCKEAISLEKVMARIGSSLRSFHHSGASPSVFCLQKELKKFEFYCREIRQKTGNFLPNRVLQELNLMNDVRCPSVNVPTLKGLDVRNVLIDPDQGIYLLDPGKIKMNYPEADVARFLMTYRILYWGSLWLLPFRQPDSKAEEVFLRSYYPVGSGASILLLNLFLLKEQLKHWHTALDSVKKRPWPTALKRFAQWIYVNPFYSRQIAKQLTALKELSH